MSSRTRLFLVAAVAVVALVVTAAALALSGLTYNKTAQLSVSRTAATVTGSVTCTPTDVTVNVFVQLLQGKGRQILIGTGSETQACPAGGGTISWTVTATTSQGQTYQPGSATVFVSAGNFDFSSNPTVTGPIKLSS